MAIIPGASLKAGRRAVSSKPSKPSVTDDEKELATATGGKVGGGPPSPSSSSKPSREPSKSKRVRSWTEDAAGKKEGKYSNAESKIVVDAIKEYAAVNSVSVEELCQAGGRTGALKAAWPSIANCLPERTVQSIYRHGIRKLKGLRSGPWSTAEVKILQSLVAKHGQKWSMVEKEMGRSAGSCRDKFREILPGAQEGGKPAWTKKEEKALNEVMMARLNLEGESPLTLTGDEKAENVQWLEVAKAVKTRNRISCHMKWSYLQAQRRKTFWQVEHQHQHQHQHQDPTVIPSGARSKRKASDDLAFVQALVSTGAADESELNWSNLSSKYPRASLLWKTLRGDRKKQSPYSNMGFQETAQAVIANLQQQLAAEKNDNAVSAGAGAGSVEGNEEGRQEKLGGQAKNKSKKTKKKKNKTRARQEDETEPKGEKENHEINRKGRGGPEEESGEPEETETTKEEKKTRGRKKREGQEEDNKKNGRAGQGERSVETEEAHQEQEQEQEQEKPNKNKKKKKKRRSGHGEDSQLKDEEEEEKRMAKKKKEQKGPLSRGQRQEKESEEAGKGGETTKLKKKRREGRGEKSEGTDEEERSKKKLKKKKKLGGGQEEGSEREDEKNQSIPSTKKKRKKRRREAVETPPIPHQEDQGHLPTLQSALPLPTAPATAGTTSESPISSSSSKRERKGKKKKKARTCGEG